MPSRSSLAALPPEAQRRKSNPVSRVNKRQPKLQGAPCGPVGWRCSTSPVSRCSPAWWWWQQATPSGDLLPGAEKANTAFCIEASICALSLSRSHDGVGGEETATFSKPGGAETSSSSKPGGADT